MRAASYVRVSTGMQVEGFSLDAQRRAIRAHCEAEGWQLVAEYVEEGVSASKESAAARPEFRRLLADVETGRVDVVVVHKLDRFSRNLVVTVQSLARLERAGAAFVSLTEHIDMTTPTGRLMLGVFALFAQFYSDNLATEVSKGRAERAAQGLPNGDLPFGYRSAGDAKLPPELVGAEAQAVAEAFRRYAGGTESAHAIAGWLNAQGFRPRSKRGLTRFTKSTVTDMLSNPFYAGKVRYRGEVLPGRQEPVVSEEVFELVTRARLSRRKMPSALSAHPARTYMLRGIGRCIRCGRRLVCSPDNTGRRYRDTSKEKHEPCGWKRQSVPAEGIEQVLGVLIRKMELPPDWREKVIAVANEAGDRDEAQRRRRSVKDRLSRLRELYLEGEVSRPRYETERARLQGELEGLDASLARSAPIEASGELLRRYAEVWDVLTEEERAQVAGSLFEEVYVDVDQGTVVCVKPRAVFLPLMRVLHREGMWLGDPERIRTADLHLDRVAC